MVKMAYSSSPGFIPLSTLMCPKEMSKASVEMGSLKGIHIKPNFIIKKVCLSSGNHVAGTIHETNTNKINVNNMRPPKIPVTVMKLPESTQEDANLLPSKIEDKKSEIVFLPIKQKSCGHDICEEIVCDVVVQQNADQGRLSPILAVNIEEDEINAPVTKHCENVLCDALNIDHNRCRRGLIKLYKCDKHHICDICGETLRKGRVRFYHKNCTRQNEYKHNNVDKESLLKKRMRELEVQMAAEDAKLKKNDYMDPVRGHDLAMETLRKNEELIIIPKTPVPSKKPIITLTTLPSQLTQSVNTNPTNVKPIIVNTNPTNVKPIIVNTNPTNVKPIIVNTNPTNIKPIIVKSRTDNLKNVDNVIAILSSVSKTKTAPINQITNSSIQQKPFNVAPITVSSVVTSQNQFVRLATPSQTTVKPTTINNCVVSSNVITTPIQPKPFLTPIRVVPITNLITAPSLLHRQQGVPKFCIMTDNVITPLMLNPPSLQPISSNNVEKQEERTSKVFIRASKISISQPKQNKPLGQKSPKKFYCDYCSKYFSTDWYFKRHVINHEKNTCVRCKKPFDIQIGKKKHNNRLCSCKKTIWYKHPGKIKLSFNQKDGKLEKHIPLIIRKKIENNSENRKDSSVNGSNGHITVHDTNELCVKRLKSDKTFINSNRDNKIFNNGITTKLRKTVEPVESTFMQEHEKESSIDNRTNHSQLNDFIFVSVPEDIDSKDFLDEAMVTSR